MNVAALTFSIQEAARNGSKSQGQVCFIRYETQSY